MVLRRLLAAFGGGTTVDTIVHTPITRPGEVIQGVTEIVGGSGEQEITGVELAFVVRVEVESGDNEYASDQQFAHQRTSGPFTLAPEQRVSIPFTVHVPLQTPFNHVDGQDLHGIRLGLRTDLEIARSVDKGDLDPVRVAPLPAQQRILAAFENIGSGFKGSDVEKGRVHGAEFGFYQELEFHAPREFAGRIREFEVTFLPGPHGMDVLIEADRKGGFLDSGGDRGHRFHVPYASVAHENWEEVLRGQLHELGRRRGLFF